jgi:hypothetical protein
MHRPLAPAAAVVWPEVLAVKAYRTDSGMLTVEIPGLSEHLLLAAIAHAVHGHMRAAGEWTACADESRDPGFPGPRGFYRLRLENAARLFAVYTTLVHFGRYGSPHEPTSEALKAAATQSYAAGLREAQTLHQSQAQPA